MLAVDLSHCERAAMQAVAGSSGQLQLLQGDMVTQGYLDALAEEVDDLLQVRGTSAAAPSEDVKGLCCCCVSGWTVTRASKTAVGESLCRSA